MENRTFTGSGLAFEAQPPFEDQLPLDTRSSLEASSIDEPGAGSTITMRRRVLFRLPPVPAREPVELLLYDPDGILVKRSRHRMMPIAVDATELPPGLYQAEFHWWNGKTKRRERVSVSI